MQRDAERMNMAVRASFVHSEHRMSFWAPDGRRPEAETQYHQLKHPVSRIKHVSNWTIGVAMMTVALVIVSVLLLLGQRRNSSVADEIDSDVIQVMRSLNQQQHANHLSQEQLESGVLTTIQRHFPWLLDRHLNTQPNVFLHAQSSPTRTTVLVQSHRVPDLQQCLQSTLTDRQAKGPVMTSDARYSWHRADHSFKSRISLHAGQYSAGLCSDFASGSCGMVSVFREPFARAVSSHEYCKSATGDELCRVANANALTLRDWTLHQSSLLLQQLTFNPSKCNLTVRQPNASHSLHGFRPVVPPTLLLEPHDYPCWYKHKILIDGLSQTQRDHLVIFISNQLEKWFSVIGLVEEFPQSVKLIEHTYNITPGRCNTQVERETSRADDNVANKKRAKREVRYDDDPDYVRYDSQVRRALDADYKIYSKAKELFQRQYRIFSNAIVH